MQFYMPVRVYEGPECVRSHLEVFRGAGSRALLVTGRRAARDCGALADVCSVLDACGIGQMLYDEVEENPSVETVMQARSFGLSGGADLVIGIGGGSALDAAKAVALMLRHPAEDAAYLYGSSETDRLPLILIPTTCGTGSEVTGVSVLTIHARKTKGSISHSIFADAALIDGRYLASVPEQVLRNTAVDALGHLWESCLNADATDYAGMCVDAGLKMWSRSREVLLASAKSGQRLYTERNYADMMRASAFAGMAIAQDGTSIPHALSYPVTYAARLPHGAAIGYFEAGYLAEGPEKTREYLLHTAGFENLADWQSFYETLCGRMQLPEELLEHAADTVMEHPEKLAKAPFAADRETVRRIAFYGRRG